MMLAVDGLMHQKGMSLFSGFRDNAMGDWKILAKGPTAERMDALPTVTIRRLSIAYNKHMRDAAKLDDFQRVLIMVDDVDFRIGFRFHNDMKDDNAYTVHFDGGSGGSRTDASQRKKRTYATQCNYLMTSHPWIRKLAQLEEVSYRRFVARRDERENLWVLQLRPSFELTAREPTQIPTGMKGIYRYIHKDEVVYIGRGSIRSRALESHRDGWDFDRIEFSAVEPDERRVQLESEWLQLHQSRYGKLPRYNRVSGTYSGEQ